MYNLQDIYNLENRYKELELKRIELKKKLKKSERKLKWRDVNKLCLGYVDLKTNEVFTEQQNGQYLKIN